MNIFLLAEPFFYKTIVNWTWNNTNRNNSNNSSNLTNLMYHSYYFHWEKWCLFTELVIWYPKHYNFQCEFVKFVSSVLVFRYWQIFFRLRSSTYFNFVFLILEKIKFLPAKLNFLIHKFFSKANEQINKLSSARAINRANYK